MSKFSILLKRNDSFRWQIDGYGAYELFFDVNGVEWYKLLKISFKLNGPMLVNRIGAAIIFNKVNRNDHAAVHIFNERSLER